MEMRKVKASREALASCACTASKADLRALRHPYWRVPRINIMSLKLQPFDTEIIGSFYGIVSIRGWSKQKKNPLPKLF